MIISVYQIMSDIKKLIILKLDVSFSGFPGEEGSRSTDGEDICHEGPEKGILSQPTSLS